MEPNKLMQSLRVMVDGLANIAQETQKMAQEGIKNVPPSDAMKAAEQYKAHDIDGKLKEMVEKVNNLQKSFQK